MGLIVQKFGGTSVANADRIRNVAQIITDTYQPGQPGGGGPLRPGRHHRRPALQRRRRSTPTHPSGRWICCCPPASRSPCALCAMAIESMGLPVVSLTGWQAGLPDQLQPTAAPASRRSTTERIQTELDRSHSHRHRDRLPGHQQVRRHHHPGPRRLATPPPWRWLRRCRPTCARSTPTWTASTPPTPATSRGPESWRRSPSTRCWSWPVWALRCSTTVRVELAKKYQVNLEVLSSFERKSGHESQGGCKANGKDP